MKLTTPKPKTNILDLDIHDVKCPIYFPFTRDFEPDLWFDGDRFIYHLKKTYDYFDVATYSFSEFPCLKIKRLITGLSFGVRKIKCEKQKTIINNHSKIFLCYKDNQVKSVFIGSQNLTSGTNINIMYRVRSKHLSILVAFFNQMWKAGNV